MFGVDLSCPVSLAGGGRRVPTVDDVVGDAVVVPDDGLVPRTPTRQSRPQPGEGLERVPGRRGNLPTCPCS